MKNRALALLGSLLLVSLFLLVSCASTKLTSSWQDAEYQGSVVDNVLVVGISDNQENRRLFEDALVKELQKNGVEAIASADAISAEKELDKDTIKAEAARLSTNLYDRETEKLIWTASSETVDPKSVKDVVGPLSKLLVRDLRDKKLIK